jgi:chemotaxis protein MotB
MKYTLTIAALAVAAACVSPETHRRVLGEKSALQAINADMAEKQKQLSAEIARLRDENRDLSSRAVDAAYVAEMKQKLAGLLAQYPEGSPAAANGVELVRTREGLALRVAGGVLFSPGQNALSEQGKKTLEEIAKQIGAQQKIRVEGHTDDTKISASQWGTNLRLSVERGMVVADFLIKSGVKDDQVSVAGYSQFRPAAEGAEDAARAKNRRVEILLLGT